MISATTNSTSTIDTETSSLIGPPISGILFQKFGFRAPFIFGIICTALDLVGRFLIIEKSDAMKWQQEPRNTATTINDTDDKLDSPDDEKRETTIVGSLPITLSQDSTAPDAALSIQRPSWSQITRRLFMSPRVIASCLIMLYNGYAHPD